MRSLLFGKENVSVPDITGDGQGNHLGARPTDRSAKGHRRSAEFRSLFGAARPP